jgi:hypothetical protein
MAGVALELLRLWPDREFKVAEGRQDRTFEVAQPYCAAEDMGDEIVALNVDTGIYFSMRGLAAFLWRDLDAGHSLEDLFGHVRDAVGSDTGAKVFTDQVVHYGLMRETARAPVGTSPKIADALLKDRGEIVLEVFDDMKDLILSDPIHDVDEAAGWPKRAAPQDISGDDVSK